MATEINENVNPDQVDTTYSEELVIDDKPENELIVEDKSVEAAQEEVLINDKDGKAEHERPSNFQLKKALKEEREKRKRKSAEQQDLASQNQALLDRINQLEKNVSVVIQDKRPDPFDYDTSDDFYTAHDAWQASNNSMGQRGTNHPDPAPTESNKLILSFDEEFHMQSCEVELKEKLPDYEEAKLDVENDLRRLIDPTGKVDIIAAIAKDCHIYGTDPAKVIYALHKIDGAKEALVASFNSPALTRRKLVELENKIKFRPRKSVDGIPETPLTQSGSLDTDKKQLDDARKKWEKDPVLENYQVYSAIKIKMREKGK